MRQRSVGHMMRELRLAKRRYKLRFLEFEDDVFHCGQEMAQRISFCYKREIGVPFQCLTHPKYMDDEIARWLAQAGCRYVQMGIQSMDEEYKYATIKRYEKNEDVERAMEAMRKYNIRVKVDHMFGLPENRWKPRKRRISFTSSTRLTVSRRSGRIFCRERIWLRRPNDGAHHR